MEILSQESPAEDEALRGGGLPEDTQRLMGNICCLLGTVFPFSFNLVLVELRR